MDNASNNDTLVEHFAIKCREEGVEFDASNARMRCLPHTIHLAALKVRLVLHYRRWKYNQSLLAT
jgi:hypothetical protein